MNLKKAVLLSGLSFFIASGLSYAADNKATVTSVQGRATFRDASGNDWREIKPGQKVSEKTEIMTGAQSRCELSLGNGGAATKIEADSYVVLESIDPVSISMQSGKIYALARNLKKGSTFQVRTPAAIASARGTGWIETMNKVQVLEDVVHVENTTGDSMDVPEDKELDITDDGKFGDLKDVPDDAKDDWKSFENQNGGQNSGDSNGNENDGPENPAMDALERQDDIISEHKDDINESKDTDAINEDLKPEEKGGGAYPG